MERSKFNFKVAVIGGSFGQMIDPVLEVVPTGKGFLAAKISDELEKYFSEVLRIGNFPGGKKCNIDELVKEIEQLDVNVVIFLAHIPNIIFEVSAQKIRIGGGEVGFLKYTKAPKIVEMVKALHPTVLLVPFKLADPETSMLEVVKWMLNIHSALAVYSKLGDREHYYIIDALGNEQMVLKDDLPAKLAQDIIHFSQAIRRQSERIGDGEAVFAVKYLDALVAFSRKMRPAFERLAGIGNVMVDRWPGNFSFRCTHSFLSSRVGDGFVVTKRNVDKTGLTKEDFVFVSLRLDDNDRLQFWGQENQKPSIDAPVHRVIYQGLPWVKSIAHGHVRVSGDAVYPRTLSRWPCGAENEGIEIVEALSRHLPYNLLVINIDGHGFIALIGEENPTPALQRLSELDFKKL